MAYTDILDAESFGVAYKIEDTAFGTEGSGDWQWLDCTLPQVSVEAVESSPVTSKRSRGSTSKRKTGAKWYRISFTAAIHGQLDTYDYTAAGPVATETGVLDFLRYLGGSATIPYAATGITPSDANTVTMTAAPSIGGLVAFGASGLVVDMGWVKSNSGGGGPYTVELFESLGEAPGAGTQVFPTLTFYPSAGSLNSFTFRVVGEPTSQDIRYAGCHLAKITLRREADRAWADFELVSYHGKTESTGGGLVVPDKWLTLDPHLGRGNERVVVGSNVITGLSGATLKPDGSCDIRDLSLTIEFPHRPIRCGTRVEGVSDVAILSPRISASFWAPKVSDLEVSGVNIFENAWTEETVLSVSSYLGDKPGQICAWQIPAAIVAGHPTPSVNDRAWGYQVTLEATHYAGDGASTNAGNKPLRIGIG